MKVVFLFISLSDLNSSGGMYSDLVNIFKEKGHQVFPIAPLRGRGKSMITQENGINVLRVGTMPLFRAGNLTKGIANILLPFQYIHAIKKYYSTQRFDLVIAPTPSIMLQSVVEYIKKREGAKFYLMLRDIFPQNAVDLNLVKMGSPIYKYFRHIEKKLYSLADYIGCMSQGNIEFIKKNNPYLSDKKLHILHNFSQDISPSCIDIDIRKRYDLEGKFIVVFGGNMGKPQQIENVLELAKRCMEYEDVVFLLVGAGTQTRRIRNLIQRDRITNIQIKNKISRNEYYLLVERCDVGLISLNRLFTTPNIPNKLTGYYCQGIAVLASLDPENDLGEILSANKTGLWAIAGDHVQLKNQFDRLYHDSDLRKRMGGNGRQFYLNNMTPESAYRTIIGAVDRKDSL